jgi:hypothetical protein
MLYIISKLTLILLFVLFGASGFSQSIDLDDSTSTSSVRYLGDSTKPVRMGYSVPKGFELIKKSDSISIFKNEDKATISVIISDTINSLIEVGFIGALKLVMLSEEKNFELLRIDYNFTIDSKEHLFAAFNVDSEQRLYFLMTKVHDRLIIYK